MDSSGVWGGFKVGGSDPPVVEIRDLDLPAAAVEHFGREGIDGLFPPQVSAVEAGVADGRSLVAAVPTASGKTLIAELAMLTAIDRGDRALYVVPLRALAAEKYRTFSAIPGVSVGIATGEIDAPPERFSGDDLVVATSEKVDSMLRHGVGWLDELGCLVVDEVHLLDAADRGPTLEVTVAKLRRRRPDMQVVALSATVENPGAIADWLDAALVESTWRPIDLRTGVAYSGTIEFATGETEAFDAGDDETRGLVRETLAGDGQAIAFVHSRRAAEELASAIAEGWLGGASGVADAVAETATSGTGRALARVLRSGVAFHHAGLRASHRTAVEAAFRDRAIDLICATPTLAAGVNLPARRVIVRDWRRYTDEGRTPLSVLEVHQMFGRAGRPGLDPVGEGLLVADSAAERDRLVERYLEGTPEAVTSKLASQAALRTHVLATIATGFAASRSELIDVLGGTFYAAQADHATLVDIADLVLDFLEAEAMIDRVDGLAATPLGEDVSRAYVDPGTAAALLDALAAADGLEIRTRRTVLEIVSGAAEMPTFYLRNAERAALVRYAERHEPEFVTMREGYAGRYEAWLSTLKTVRILDDWADGVAEAELTERHGIGPGDLRTVTERAGWLLQAAEALASRRALGVVPTVRAAHEAVAARPPDVA